MKVAREQFVLFEWRPCPSDIDERDAVDEKEDKGEVHSPPTTRTTTTTTTTQPPKNNNDTMTERLGRIKYI